MWMYLCVCVWMFAYVTNKRRQTHRTVELYTILTAQLLVAPISSIISLTKCKIYRSLTHSLTIYLIWILFKRCIKFKGFKPISLHAYVCYVCMKRWALHQFHQSVVEIFWEGSIGNHRFGNKCFKISEHTQIE